MLRVLVDRTDSPARFLILGSASGSLLRQTSESLAGRTERVLLGGFTTGETAAANLPGAGNDLWRRGGLPRSFLAATEEDSVAWRREYIRTLLERDFPQWGVRAPAAAMGRFWAMLAHYHAQTWNAGPPARALGVSPGVVRRYLDTLTDALMVRQLPPWFANLKKRQVKAPKVYVRDSGLLHRLLGIDTEKALMTHPGVGASWEGFAIEQVLARRAPRRGVLLGDAPRRGDRSDPAPERGPVRRRVQARRRAPHHAVHPERPRRRGPGQGGHPLSGGAARPSLRPGRAGPAVVPWPRRAAVSRIQPRPRTEAPPSRVGPEKRVAAPGAARIGDEPRATSSRPPGQAAKAPAAERLLIC